MFLMSRAVFFQIWKNGIGERSYFPLRVHDLPEIRHKIGEK